MQATAAGVVANNTVADVGADISAANVAEITGRMHIDRGPGGRDTKLALCLYGFVAVWFCSCVVL